MKTKNILIITFFISGYILSLCTAAGDSQVKSLKSIHENVKKQSSEGKVKVEKLSSDFKIALSVVDLSPTQDILAQAGDLQGISTTLLESLVKNGIGTSDSEVDAVSGATKALLKKLDEIIDKNYKLQMGRANVSPPPGVPNAAAGMDPNGISDLNLRKEYLASIDAKRDKTYKNDQQLQLKRLRIIVVYHIASLNSNYPSGKFSRDKLVEKFTEVGESRNLLLKTLGSEPVGK